MEKLNDAAVQATEMASTLLPLGCSLQCGELDSAVKKWKAFDSDRTCIGDNCHGHLRPFFAGWAIQKDQFVSDFNGSIHSDLRVWRNLQSYQVIEPVSGALPFFMDGYCRHLDQCLRVAAKWFGGSGAV